MNRNAFLTGTRKTRGRVLLLAVATAVLAALVSIGSSLTPSAGAEPADGAGYRDFSYSNSADKSNAGPTSEKPQSKLWFNDGSWWGVLFNSDTGRYEIYEYDRDSHSWTTTETVVDERDDSRADVLWDQKSGNLYIASAGPKSADPAVDAANSGRFTRYSYDAEEGTYTRQGDPITVTNSGVEALVLERDTTGQFWVTFTRNEKVRVNRSLDETGRAWGDPFILPVAGADNLTSDDISSIISFDGKIGVMWSNQTDSTVRFATHADTNPDDTAFQEDQPLIDRDRGSDDHLNLKSLQAVGGKVYAAVKTAADCAPTDNGCVTPDPNAPPEDPLNLLLVRNQDGTFEEHVFGRVRDKHTRPIVLIDQQNNDLYMFATAPTGGGGTQNGGTIYFKKTPLANISFEEGRGTPFIQSSTDTDVNDATSTKQNLNGTTDLLVEASDRETNTYLHNYIDLEGTAPPANTAPTVTNVRPAPGSKTRDATPVISATVRDAQTDLSENDISLSVDGKQIGQDRFVYNPDTDKLRYRSSKLSRGVHRVNVTATDGEDSTTKAWRFRVVRR